VLHVCGCAYSALLGWLEAHTGIRKLYLASALLVLALLLVFRGTGMGLLSVCVGFLYPLHMSLKTIENCASLFEQISGANRARHTEEQIEEKREEIIQALRKWLVYWVVYGLFNTLESLSDSALSWLPVYHPVKLAFLLWCFLPRFQGSQLVFDILVRPVLIRHESAIEESVETAQQGQCALHDAHRPSTAG
jgi:receptor expression-enhancing protein 5/6